MSDELKPCPFCGTTEMLRRVGAQPGEGWSFVRCDYCDAEGPDSDNLPGHWNTRTSPDDEWTRWKMGESIDALAKERGCTRERMRLRLKRLDEGRTVLALQERVDHLRRVLELCVDDLEHWAACADSLKAAGFNMDDTAWRAEYGRAALAKLDAT